MVLVFESAVATQVVCRSDMNVTSKIQSQSNETSGARGRWKHAVDDDGRLRRSAGAATAPSGVVALEIEDLGHVHMICLSRSRHATRRDDLDPQSGSGWFVSLSSSANIENIDHCIAAI